MIETIGIIVLKVLASFAVSVALWATWLLIASKFAVWLENLGVSSDVGSDVVQALTNNWPAVIIMYGSGIAFYFYIPELLALAGWAQ